MVTLLFPVGDCLIQVQLYYALLLKNFNGSACIIVLLVTDPHKYGSIKRCLKSSSELTYLLQNIFSLSVLNCELKQRHRRWFSLQCFWVICFSLILLIFFPLCWFLHCGWHSPNFSAQNPTCAALGTRHLNRGKCKSTLHGKLLFYPLRVKIRDK